MLGFDVWFCLFVAVYSAVAAVCVCVCFACIVNMLHNYLLANAPHLMLDMCFVAEDATLRADSQITALKYMPCQNLHINTTPTTITSKYICKCSVCAKNWYESQVVSGSLLALLGVKMVQ